MYNAVYLFFAGGTIMAVVINGRDLTIEDAIRVARDMEKVEIAEDAKERVDDYATR